MWHNIVAKIQNNIQISKIFTEKPPFTPAFGAIVGGATGGERIFHGRRARCATTVALEFHNGGTGVSSWWHKIPIAVGLHSHRGGTPVPQWWDSIPTTVGLNVHVGCIRARAQIFLRKRAVVRFFLCNFAAEKTESRSAACAARRKRKVRTAQGTPLPKIEVVGNGKRWQKKTTAAPSGEVRVRRWGKSPPAVGATRWAVPAGGCKFA